jgi:hypothetical protein
MLFRRPDQGQALQEVALGVVALISGIVSHLTGGLLWSIMPTCLSISSFFAGAYYAFEHESFSVFRKFFAYVRLSPL